MMRSIPVRGAIYNRPPGEFHLNLPFPHAGDVADPREIVGTDLQLETLWDASGGHDVEAGPELGQASHGTVDRRMARIEADAPGLEHAAQHSVQVAFARLPLRAGVA